MVTTLLLKTSVTVYLTTEHHIPEDHTLDIQLLDNFKSFFTLPFVLENSIFL